MNYCNMETTYKWCDLEPHQEQLVIASHASAFKIRGGTKRFDTLKRIFRLGQPTVTIATGEKVYCRIEKESVDVMNILCQEYLK